MASVKDRQALDLSMNAVSYVKRSFIQFVISKKNLMKRVDASQFAKDMMNNLTKIYTCEGVKGLLEKVNAYVGEQVGALRSLGYEVLVDTVMVTTSRLAIGLRSPYMEVLEQGISWDPIMNLPYIPASSLKGAIRASAQGTPCEQALGTTEDASHIVVLDSYPVLCTGRSLLTLDIINPHYREASGEVAEPQVSPTPIPILTVSKGVGFRIVLMIERRRLRHRCGKEPGDYVTITSNCEGVCTVDHMVKTIKEAFMRGIGAKTALGYGLFQ